MKDLLVVRLFIMFICIVGQSASASGGWLWSDEFPWIYSHKENGWMYLSAQGDQIYVYRPSTKEWSLFVATNLLSNSTGESDASNSELIFDGSNPPSTLSVDLSTSIGLEMIWVNPGTFTMGSPESEVLRDETERQHNVTLTKGFYLGKYEVTHSQYLALTGENPQSKQPGNLDLPVHRVSHDEAMAFIQLLNNQQSAKIPAGWSFILPTEAEWEYACRAGTSTAYSWGNDLNASHARWKGSRVHPAPIEPVSVGQFEPNPWGFFDMHGNAAEWVADWHQNWNGSVPVIDPTGPKSGQWRVVRGGDYTHGSNTGGLRSSARSAGSVGKNDSNHHSRFGFRFGLKLQ
jgi:formylglycine-generating enzyme required for sulfatase activity